MTGDEKDKQVEGDSGGGGEGVISAEDKARVESEARRQKILAKAGNRLDMVHHAPAEEGAASEGPSKASKMAAMRRRRFKKSAPAKEESKDEAAVKTTETKDKAEPANADTKENIEKPSETVKNGTSGTSDSVESGVADQKDDGANAQPFEGEVPKKKYMGVARMRRKKIEERRAKEEEEAKASGTASVAPKTTVRKVRKVSALPVVMHIVTVLLLFLAGLDIGLQQARIEYNSESLTVYTQVAPPQGLRLVDAVTGSVSSLTKTSSSPFDKVVEDPSAYAASEGEDEFQEQVVEKKKKANIDPLFQVDLDEYTQGSGLFMMAGRFAVACHRVNLSVFYYFPLNVVHRIKSTVFSLIETPPMLCLCALGIRQAVGKFILGAHLPDSVQDAQGKDIASMVKNFIKSFFLKAFPTLANLYDAWVHLRADMYIILCGLFVGIAWHHFIHPHPVVENMAALSEVVEDMAALPEAVPTQEPVLGEEAAAVKTEDIIAAEDAVAAVAEETGAGGATEDAAAEDAAEGADQAAEVTSPNDAAVDAVAEDGSADDAAADEGAEDSSADIDADDGSEDVTPDSEVTEPEPEPVLKDEL